MIRKRIEKMVPVTKVLCREIRDLEAWKGDRRLKPKRVEELQRALDRGMFIRPVNWVTAWCKGVQYRVNGNHSSHLLSDNPIPAGLQCVYESYEVDTLEELAELWAQYDSMKSSRTSSEILNAASKVHDGLAHISASAVTHIVAGIAWADSKGGSQKDKKMPIDERQQLVHENQDFIVWANQMMDSPRRNLVGNPRPIIDRTPVLAAMFNTWSVDPLGANDFWVKLRDDAHPDPSHPTRVLRKFLLNPSGDKKLGGTNAKDRWSPIAFYVKCILAWEASRVNKVTDLKFYEDRYLDNKTKKIKNFPMPS